MKEDLRKELSILKKEQYPKVEGYWRKTEQVSNNLLFPEDEYPFPIKDVLSIEEANKIYSLIRQKERGARKVAYKGCSWSRITNEQLGCEEYETKEYIWPGDFAEHYVLKHRVRPSNDFLKFIGYKNI